MCAVFEQKINEENQYRYIIQIISKKQEKSENSKNNKNRKYFDVNNFQFVCI